jgi:hypothetical protein
MSQRYEPQQRNENEPLGKFPLIIIGNLLHSTQHLGTWDSIRLSQNYSTKSDLVDIDSYERTSKPSSDETTYKRVLYVTCKGEIMTMKPDKPHTTVGLTYFHKDRRAVLNVSSAPKLVYGTSAVPLAPEHIPTFYENLHTVTEHLTTIDWMNASVSRLDSATVYNMTNLTGDYIGLLNHLAPPKFNRLRKQEYGLNETVTFLNKSQRYKFYDKAEEQRSKGYDIPKEMNLLRPEHSALNKTKIRAIYGSISLKHLNHEQTIMNGIKVRQKCFKQLFRLDHRKAQQYQTELNMMREMKLLKQRSAADKIVMMSALAAGYDINRLEKMMQSCGYNRSTILRTRRKLNELKAMAAPDVAELYHEIHSKIMSDNVNVA